jgi:hypothetical protein
MRNRVFHILAAIIWAVFSIVVVPVHTPGMMRLDGKPVVRTASSCCSRSEAPVSQWVVVINSGKNGEKPQTVPFKPDRTTCVICHLVAKLDKAPPLILWQTQARGSLPDFVWPERQNPSTITPLSHHSRAPPTRA